MKKLLFSFILIILSFSMFSCGNHNEHITTITVPNGIPYLAIGGLLSDDSFSINPVVGGQSLQAELVGGNSDIVIAPINVGIKLIKNKKSTYKLAGVLTTNNAYIVSENEISSINDLKNKSVVAFGEAGIPGQLLKSIYNNNSLDISNINFLFNSSAEVFSGFVKGTVNEEYALMSEPEITKLKKANKDTTYYTVDLSKEAGFEVSQAAIFVNPNLDSQIVDKALLSIKNNIKDIEKDINSYTNRIIGLDNAFSQMGFELISEVLPKCSITFLSDSKAINKTLALLGIEELKDEETYFN